MSFFVCYFAAGNKPIKFQKKMSSKKSTPKVKEPVKIRFKQLKNGNKSIYLARWNNSRQKWEYEFLKDLYIIPETSPEAKKANIETLRLANAVKAQKTVDIQNVAHGFSATGGRSKINVIDYIKTLAEEKRAKSGKERGTYQGYLALARQISEYSGTKTTFKQTDKIYCQGFLDFLKTAANLNRGQGNKPLSENTRFWYMKVFEAVLNAAISDEIILINPFKQIKADVKPAKHKAEICYLTIEDLRTLENTPCFNPVVKQAFLFSCYSGLRYSDVCNLTWGKLQRDNEGNIFINFVQEKTNKQEYLPIPQKALNNLPDRTGTKDTDFIFNLPSDGYVNIQLRQWAFQAGITKHIHFHVARHTYATLLLSLEVPIETVSKNLGHSEIRTTQIYAKVVNAAQRAAVSKLDGLTN
jgi:integrase